MKLTEHVALCRATTALTCTRAVASEIVQRQFPRLLADGAGVKVDALVAEQLEKVEPAFAYFETKTIELKAQLQFYEAATMFHPVLVKRRGGLAEAELRRLIAYNKPATIAALVSELSRYVADYILAS